MPEQKTSPVRLTPQHASGDAYLLMLYVGHQTGQKERIWNSRDGVTPFGVLSRDGSEDMFHQRWRDDVYAPLHVPDVGDRIFVDFDQARATKFYSEMVEREWSNPKHPMSEQWETKEQAVHDLVQSSIHRHEGTEYFQPTCIVVTESIRKQFEERAAWRLPFNENEKRS